MGMKESAIANVANPPIHENPHVLTALLHLRRAGMCDADAMRALRVSRRTFYRCVAAIKAREQRSRRERDDD